ncbi:MAG TPA: transcription termination/antitermination NusG family protein [Anaerolineales bacterium]|jgi:transcriptional antiterminator RfaH
MATRWYALRSKPRKEDVLWRQIKAQDYEIFYPRIRVQPVNPRSKKVRPYFPGYMFIRVDLEEVGKSTFNWMPHAIGLVSFGGEPAWVPDNLVHAVRKRVDEINEAGGELFEGLQEGDEIRIKEGPFAGYEAIFDARIPGSERVRVLIQMLSDRQVPVELRAGQIRKKKK